MSTKDLSALEAGEIDHVKRHLLGLAEYLQGKKGTGSSPGRLLPDEEAVLGSITHPERGDVLITVVRGGRRPMVFISNRRDANAPFVVMDADDIRQNPGRRTLDGSRLEPHEGRVGVYLCSMQDQEQLRSLAQERIDIYSVHFGLFAPAGGGTPAPDKPTGPDLKTKALNQCTVAEKWAIYKSDWDMDPRRKAIEQELFSFAVTFPKYRQPPKEEHLILSPTKHAQILGQMIRDIYPPNVRRSLVRDFPEDHKKQIDLCHRYMVALVQSIEERMKPANGDEYNSFLKELKDVIEEVLRLDPDLTQF